MTERGLEVTRYRITLTASEDSLRTVLTCKGCPLAPDFLPDPPIFTTIRSNRPGAAIGMPSIVRAAFRHEIAAHPPSGVRGWPDRGGTVEATPDGLRSLAQLLDEFAVLAKGEIGVWMAGLAVTGGLSETAPGLEVDGGRAGTGVPCVLSTRDQASR